MSVWGTIEPEATDERMYGSMTPEQLAAWLNQRCGCLTASRAYDALHKTKRDNKYSASRYTLLKQILAERLTGESVDHYVSEPMKWGLAQEPFGKMAYEATTGNLLAPCGYIAHPTIEHLGATPDSLINDDGVFELKCPNTTTFIEFRMTKQIPEEYEWQLCTQLVCTGRTWADFAMFDPRVKRMENIIIERFRPVQSWLEMVEKEAKIFLDEVETAWDQLIHSPLQSDKIAVG